MLSCAVLCCAVQEFESAEVAAALMQSDWRDALFLGQHRLRFEVARQRRPEAAADWACEFCQAVNFGR